MAQNNNHFLYPATVFLLAVTASFFFLCRRPFLFPFISVFIFLPHLSVWFVCFLILALVLRLGSKGIRVYEVLWFL
jgi:hypothetical protein